MRDLMAPSLYSSSSSSNGLNAALFISLMFSLVFLPSKPAAGFVLAVSGEQESMKKGRVALGSRPPQCVNKCFSCRPCMATLVIPPHQRKSSKALVSRHDDEGYYLLSWKCTCGNKFFSP